MNSNIWLHLPATTATNPISVVPVALVAPFPQHTPFVFYPPKKNIAADWPLWSVGGFFVVRVHSVVNQPEAINFFRIFSRALLIVLRTVASLAI